VRFDRGGANRVIMRLESLCRGGYAPESRGVIFECRRVEGSGLVCVSRPWVRGASARTCERILEWVFLQSARGLFEEVVKARHGGGSANPMPLHLLCPHYSHGPLPHYAPQTTSRGCRRWKPPFRLPVSKTMTGYRSPRSRQGPTHPDHKPYH
jgi:hypothetical protein